MHHAETVRFLLGDRVDDVEGEVEAVCIFKGDLKRIAVLALLDGHEIRDEVRGFEGVRGSFLFDCGGSILRDQAAFFPFEVGAFLRKDDREKADVLAADGDDAVGVAGIVENAVARMQDLLIVLDADLHGAFKDIVEFLARVGHLLDRRMLLFLIVIVDDVVGIGNAVLEEVGDVLDDDAGLHARELAAAASRQGVAGQQRGLALKELHDLHVEDRGAFVDEGEGKIRRAALVGDIVGKVEAGHVGHLALGIAAVKP